MKSSKLKNSISITHKKRIEILLSYYSDVLHYLGAFNLTPEDVEDALQDTYIEAFTYIDKVRDESKLKFWLLKIAKRQGLKYLSKNKTKSSNEQPLMECINFPEVGSSYSSDKQINDLIRNMNREKLRKLISRLSDKEQKVLVLYYDYGYRLKDIAIILKESDSNVRSISRRSKEKLRKMIENEDIDLKPWNIRQTSYGMYYLISPY